MTNIINYSLLLIFCLLASSCVNSTAQNTGNPYFKTTIQNSWNTNSKAIVNKEYTGAWIYHSNTLGKSIVIRLYQHVHEIGTFDGNSHYEIAFQLPAKIQTGKTYLLNPIPELRLTKKEGVNNSLAEMHDGEITAFKFGNPVCGFMKTVDVASVQIVSIGKKSSIIHLKLKTKLEPHWSFDIDQNFKVEMFYNKLDKKSNSGHPKFSVKTP